MGHRGVCLVQISGEFMSSIVTPVEPTTIEKRSFEIIESEVSEDLFEDFELDILAEEGPQIMAETEEVIPAVAEEAVFLTTGVDAAKKLGISRNTLRKWLGKDGTRK